MTLALIREELRRRGRQFVRSRDPESATVMIELVVDLVKVKNMRSMEYCFAKMRGLDRVLTPVRDQTPAHEHEVRDSVQILENAQLVQNQNRRLRTFFLSTFGMSLFLSGQVNWSPSIWTLPTWGKWSTVARLFSDTTQAT